MERLLRCGVPFASVAILLVAEEQNLSGIDGVEVAKPGTCHPFVAAVDKAVAFERLADAAVAGFERRSSATEGLPASKIAARRGNGTRWRPDGGGSKGSGNRRVGELDLLNDAGPWAAMHVERGR